MTGKLLFSVDATQFAKGISSGDAIANGGFSGEVGACNLTYEPGILNGIPATVDKTGSLSANIIAHCPTAFATGGTAKNGFILTADGKVGAVQSTQSLSFSSVLAGTYTSGVSDIINFLTYVFVTTANDIARMDTDLTNPNATWGSGTASISMSTAVPHPMLAYIGRVYVADGYKVHYISGASTGVDTKLALTQANTITAMGIDASTGKMLIATYQGILDSNGLVDGTSSGQSRVFIYNGESPTPDFEIPVEAPILSFRNIGGVTRITTPTRKGYWNGAGISYLGPKFKNIIIGTSTAADLPYKHHTAVIENNYYVADGTRIAADSEVIPGQRAHYYAVENDVNSNNFTTIFHAGNYKLGLGFGSSKFATFDTVGTGTGKLNPFRTLKYSFPQPIMIDYFNVEYSGSGVANLDTARSLYYATGDAPSTFVQLDPLDNNSGSTLYEQRYIAGVASNPVYSIQLKYLATATPGIRRISCFGHAAE